MSSRSALALPGDAAVPVTFVDEAVAAAEGIRAAARWLASSLGAIPSLAVLASIVRTPGSGGFDPTKLALGIALAALGAVTGVLFFAWVIAPVPLEDGDLRTLDLTRIPGQPYTNFDQLDSNLEFLRKATAEKEYHAFQKLADAEYSEAQAHKDELAANEAEGRSAASPGDQALKEIAQEARADAERQKVAAAARAAAAAAEAEMLTIWTTQVARRDMVRQDAYRLKATDVVGRRYLIARIGAVLSVALIAGGVILLGLAPDQPRLAASAMPRSQNLTPTAYETRPLNAVSAIVMTGGS